MHGIHWAGRQGPWRGRFLYGRGAMPWRLAHADTKASQNTGGTGGRRRRIGGWIELVSLQGTRPFRLTYPAKRSAHMAGPRAPAVGRAWPLARAHTAHEPRDCRATPACSPRWPTATTPDLGQAPARSERAFRPGNVQSAAQLLPGPGRALGWVGSPNASVVDGWLIW